MKNITNRNKTKNDVVEVKISNENSENLDILCILYDTSAEKIINTLIEIAYNNAIKE